MPESLLPSTEFFPMAHIIFLDNFDSFTYNLVDQFRVLGHQVTIYSNDTPLDALVKATQVPNAILALSPGPGNPQESGNLLPLLAEVKDKVPVIGICLGLQALVEAFGGKIVHAGEVLHGKCSQIDHDGLEMFANLPVPLSVARYHSLRGENIPPELIVNATYTKGDTSIPMAIRHQSLPIVAFQFHPESVFTVYGSKLLEQSIAWLEKVNAERQAG